MYSDMVEPEDDTYLDMSSPAEDDTYLDMSSPAVEDELYLDMSASDDTYLDMSPGPPVSPMPGHQPLSPAPGLLGPKSPISVGYNSYKRQGSVPILSVIPPPAIPEGITYLLVVPIRTYSYLLVPMIQ